MDTDPLLGCGNTTAQQCTLNGTSDAVYNTTRIVCTVPPGVGSSLEAYIGGVWTALSAGYAAPVVASIHPSWVGVAGGSLLIAGSNFGDAPCASWVRAVISQPTATASSLTFDEVAQTWVPAGGKESATVPCAVTRWTPAEISCTLPPGLDAAVAISVSVGGQVYSTPDAVGYLAPVLHNLTAVAPLVTAGGAVITIVGEEFPLTPWPVAVLVGGRACEVDLASRTASRVSCRTPAGAGVVSVTLLTPLQASSNSLELVYAPPVVTGVSTPQGRPLDGGFSVLVTGKVRRTLQRPQCH